MIQKLKNITLSIALLASISLGSCQQNTNGKGGKVSVDEFEQLIAKNANAQVIDVRTPDEFLGGHIKNARNININAGDFEQQIATLNKKEAVYVYCLSGGRSSSAASYLRNNGFAVVYEMPGMMAWNSAGKPVESGASAPEKKGLTLEEYQKQVTNSKYVLVDFNAVWCKPCKALAPILEKISIDKKDKLILLKIDADLNADLLAQKHIDAIPQIELYKDGKLIWEHKGMVDEATILAEIK